MFKIYFVQIRMQCCSGLPRLVWYGFFIQWHVNLPGLFNAISVEEKVVIVFNPYLEVDKGFHTFPKCIKLKIYVKTRLEFELTYYDVAVQDGNSSILFFVALLTCCCLSQHRFCFYKKDSF